MEKNNFNDKFIKRFISILLVGAMVLNGFPSDGFLGGIFGENIFRGIGLMVVGAADVSGSDAVTDTEVSTISGSDADITVVTKAVKSLPSGLALLGAANTEVKYGYSESNFADKTLISFSAVKEFMAYCYFYSIDDEFAAAHQKDTLDIVMRNDSDTDRGVLTSDYVGLGTVDYPFCGTVKLPDNSQGNFEFTNEGNSFFNYVYDCVPIISDSNSNEIKIQLKRTTDVGAGIGVPVFAQHVVAHAIAEDNDIRQMSSANWTVELTSGNTGTYSGVIGEICEGATVNLTYINRSTANVVSNAPAD